MEVARQILGTALSKFCQQKWQFLQFPKATQLPNIAHARGVWGYAPMKMLNYFI